MIDLDLSLKGSFFLLEKRKEQPERALIPNTENPG
jgi:hypothetical protein